MAGGLKDRAKATNADNELLGLYAWAGERSDHELLEAIFTEANGMGRADWLSVRVRAVTQPSMSVGDVVVIHRDGRVHEYLCASTGWACVLDAEAP